MNHKALITIAILTTSCTGDQLAQLNDASNKRKVVCEFIDNSDAPQKAKDACAAGEDLEAIARAYGRCDAE